MVLQIVFIMASMFDGILGAVGCVIAWDCFRKKRRKRGVCCKEWLLKRTVYSHKNVVIELEVFLKDLHNYLRMDHDTYLHFLSLVTPFISKEDTLMTTHPRSNRLGKFGHKAEKCLISSTYRGLKNVATDVGEFLKAWTVQAEP
jgi:hypothetical protein